MEKFIVENDINVMYVEATSFPMGITQSHVNLHNVVPLTEGRRFFGISRPEKEKNGEVVYKAAATILSDDEPEKYKLSTMTIPAGTYISKVIEDYFQNIPKIGEAFAEMLKLPDIDPNGYCIEQYTLGNTVRCMVRLADL